MENRIFEQEKKNLVRVRSLTELFTLTNNNENNNNHDKHNGDRSSATTTIRKQDFAMKGVANRDYPPIHHHHHHNQQPHSEVNYNYDSSSIPSIGNASKKTRENLDEIEIQWLISCGFNRTQALAMYTQKLNANAPAYSQNKFEANDKTSFDNSKRLTNNSIVSRTHYEDIHNNKSNQAKITRHADERVNYYYYFLFCDKF
jgi:hypothetical protein